jgi:glycosyltransferase involved in cell wall biosynthesis
MTIAISGGNNPDQAIDVSVLLITYNHAQFIRAAIESVLSQRTKRSFELIVSEDASTDGTLEIVRELAKSDERIRPIFSANNLRSNEPVSRALNAARGRYVCLLDGDDCWLVDDKIERQADLLDENDDASACFHNALVSRDDGPSGERWTAPGVGPRVTFSEMWEGNPFATCSGMLRKSALESLGSWYVKCFPITDWPLYLLCAEQGDILFVDEPVGLYRLHAGGEVSRMAESGRLRLIARFYKQMIKANGGRWASVARDGGSLYFAGKARQFIDQSDPVLARLSTKFALQAGGVGRSVSWRDWLGLVRRSIR